MGATTTTPKEQQIIQTVAAMIREKFSNDASGHDWYHMERVWKMAQKIGQAEGANMFIVEMAALLHDYADWKLDIDHAQETEAMNNFLRSQGVIEKDIVRIGDIIKNVSFKGLSHDASQKTIEGQAVQDADRLDAIGAIAIARVFAYGGHRGRPIYDPTMDLKTPLSDQEYVDNTRSGLAHFYDKLLHLKDLMNTNSAKVIAQERHQYMEEYVERFLTEWNGRR